MAPMSEDGMTVRNNNFAFEFKVKLGLESTCLDGHRLVGRHGEGESGTGAELGKSSQKYLKFVCYFLLVYWFKDQWPFTLSMQTV